MSSRTGECLENGIKQRIRNVLSVLFTHAQRYEFISQGYNPVNLVRQTDRRSRIPDILESWKMNAIRLNSSLRELASNSLAYGNGLRVSEEFALQETGSTSCLSTGGSCSWARSLAA